MLSWITKDLDLTDQRKSYGNHVEMRSVMNQDDELDLFEATPSDWRISNLRSAYEGILNEEAIEFEIARFRTLQELSKRKTAATVARYTYDATLQSLLRISLLWALYTHAFFRLQHFIPFFFSFLLRRPDTSIPPLKAPFEGWDGWMMRRLLVSPSLCFIMLAVGCGLEIIRRKLWWKYKIFFIMVLGGCVVIFISLVLR